MITHTELIVAALHIDWGQVTLNRGNVCYHLFQDGGHEHGRFCCRGTNWPGHLPEFGTPDHKFVTLADLLRKSADLYVVESIATQARADRLEAENKLLRAALAPCLKKEWFSLEHIVGDVVISLNAADVRAAMVNNQENSH